MDQHQTVSLDYESGASEPKEQKTALTCAGSSRIDDAWPNVDDICSSSTSSTTTENTDVRPTVALSAETSPLTEVAGSTDVSRRVSARCKREETEPRDRKLLPRRSKSKKSQKDATSTSSAVNAAVPDVSLEQLPPQVVATDPLPSDSSLLLPVKPDPCCESSIVPDSGDTASCTSLPGVDDECLVADGTSSRPPMSLMEADAYSYHTESGIMDKVCAFCSRGEKSLLGQGELTCYEPTPGFHPFKRQLSRVGAKRALSEPDEITGRRGQQSLTWRRTRGPLRQQSSLGNEKTKPALPQRANSQPALDVEGRPLPTVDELSLVGYQDDVEVSQLFEKTGQVWAHHCCAAWSEGVIQTDDYSLRFVDKAVFAGVTQKCSYCMCHGATISCRYSRCSKKYHYPCASGSGCFQDIKSMSLLCPDHTDEAVSIANQEACCVVCDLPGNISDQLFCTSCGQHYHGNCLDPAVEVNPIVRAGWQCPECKICQTCRQPGDDNKMLVCDTCDKGYHTFCLMPVMTTIPKNGWKCKNCRICGDCGSRTPGSGPSSRWHLNYSICDSCYQQRNKGLCCPVCCKAYRHFTQSKMLPCSQCKRYVHSECDESIEQNKLKPEEYICLACKSQNTLPFEASSLTDSLPSVTDEGGLQDIENFSIFKGLNDLGSNHDDVEEMAQSSQESLVMTEDSISSMDIDLNALEKGVQQLGSVMSPGVHDTNSAGMALLSCGLSDDTSSKAGEPAVFSNRSSRLAGPGIGKPAFDSECGKKGSACRQRSRSAGVGKKKRPASSHSADRKRSSKPKLKQMSSYEKGNGSQDQNGKDDDHAFTTVLCSARDHFTLKQDMCLSCGSYGVGEEGKLIACVQCGQCYHPYCVNIKISKTMLQKGWRCLDCTVCEGCGKPHDESRLILCDECDISFHIYCLDPPLDEVPQGAWKCKWCIVCVTCGATSPGIVDGCAWQNNYSQCARCASLEVCPACSVTYTDGELILQCAHCGRWLHGSCDGISNEDEAELAIDHNYHCVLCRAVTGAPAPVVPLETPPVSSPLLPATPVTTPSLFMQKEFDMPLKVPKTFFLDGVCLSEAGLNQIRGLSLKFAEKKQRPRWRRNPSTSIHPALLMMMSEKSEDDQENADSKTATMDTPDTDEGKLPETAVADEWDVTSPPIEQRPADASTALASPEKKKKPRIRGMGIGGFMPRSRSRGGWQMRGGRCVANSSRPASGAMEAACGEQDDEMKTDAEKKLKPKRPRKVIKKSHMEDSYPTYLQEAFFGRGLLDKCKDNKLDDLDLESDDDKEYTDSTCVAAAEDSTKHFSSASVAEMMEFGKSTVHAAVSQSSQLPQDGSQTVDAVAASTSWQAAKAVCGDLTNIPPTSGHDEDSDKEHNIDEADLDVLPQEPIDEDDIISLQWEDIAHASTEPTELHEHLSDDTGRRLPDNITGLEAMLNPNMEELAQIDNETLEVILKTDRNDETSPTSPTGNNFLMDLPEQRHSTNILSKPAGHTDDGLFSRQDTSSNSISPFSSSLGADDLPGLWPQSSSSGHFGSAAYHDMNVGPSMMGGDEAGESLSYNQRNIKKWETDEPLGDLATISPVLYANMCHPDLKIQYPEWSERAKQITKLWRKVPSDQRAPYLAKARDNRASVRMQKSQKEMKRRPKESATSSANQSVGSTAEPSTPGISRQPSLDLSESSNNGSTQIADEKDVPKTETDGCALLPQTPQTPPNQSFASCTFSQTPRTVFKQPHPPALQSSPVYEPSHPQLVPGSLRPTAESFPQQHQQPPQHGGPVEQCVSQPGLQPVPDHFVRQAVIRPGSTPSGALRTGPPGADSGQYMRSTFGAPFHIAGHGAVPSRFMDPFHGPGGHPVRSSGDHFGVIPEHYAAVSSVSSPIAQSPEGFQVHYGSDHYIRGQMNQPRGTYPVNADMYMRMPMNPRVATSDPYARARMTPSPSDPHTKPQIAPRSVVADHYMPCMPLPPRPLSNELFPRSAATTDPYVRQPVTPRPAVSDPYVHSPASSDSFPRQPTTPLSEPRSHQSLAASPSDPYVRTPMTPRPSSEPYSRPPSSELAGPVGTAVDVPRQPSREPSAETLSSPSMDEDQSRQQQQQQPDVRELLAKHTKQRQSKKKQEESRQQQQQQEQQLSAASGSQLPLRHWPDDAASSSQTPTKPHDGQSRSPMPEYSGPPVSVSFAGRDIDQAIRQPYQGQLRPTKPGDIEMPFGSHGMLQGELHHRFPGQMRSMRPGMGVGLPQPGMRPPHMMTPGHYAVPHRQMPPYSEVARPEEQINTSLGGMSSMPNRPSMYTQEGVQPHSYHARMPTSHRMSGPPYAGHYDSVMVSGGAVLPPGMSPQQHQQMMMSGGWAPEFYRPRGPVPTSNCMMYPIAARGPPPPPQNAGNATVPVTASSELSQAESRATSGQAQQKTDGEDIGDKSEGDQFEDLIGAGENFNILEYTDSEIDSAAAEHQEKSSGDQHNVAHQAAVHVPASVKDSGSSSSVSLSESSSMVSSAAGLSMSSASLTSSTPVMVTAAFTEAASLSASLSSKPFSTSEASVGKCSAASEDAMKSEGSRTSESCTKSVPTAGFMTTDFQAKFLEFSQRKAACVTVGQNVPIDDLDAAGSTNSTKVKKADALAAPSTLKKSSPVAEDSVDSVEMKPGECHSSSSESQPEVPTTLPMQVDGCCDSYSDDDADESDVLSDVDMTLPRSNYSVDTQYAEFMNKEEPELVEIWRSSIGLQVDGAADDEADDAKENEGESTTNYDGQIVADNQHQLSDGSEAGTAAVAADTGVSTTLAAVEAAAPSCSLGVVDSSCSVSDSAVASLTFGDSVLPNERKLAVDTTKQLHSATDVSTSVNRKLIEESESGIVTPQLRVEVSLPGSVSVSSTSDLQPSIPKTSNFPLETSVQCLQSDTSQTLECPVTGEAAVVTSAATAAFATSLVPELQSSSTCEDSLLTATANTSAVHLELTSHNSSLVSDGDVVPSRLTVNHPLTATATSSLPPSVVPSISCTTTVSVASSCEITSIVNVESGRSSHSVTVASIVGSDCSSVNTASHVVESHTSGASAVAVDPAAGFSVPGSHSAIANTVAVSVTGHVDSLNNVAATNQSFNGAFQLRPEMQPFMGHPPRRMYLPPEFHMQNRMMQHSMPAGEGVMIPAEQLPHGPPPPYPNKQFAGPQAFWVRQQHPSSGMPPEWIRHPGDFGHRQLLPNVGSHEWSRPPVMPGEWSGRPRMQQEWVYFQQQSQQHSQAPRQWIRPLYSNMPGFQPGTADAAPMQADAYSSGYQPAPRNIANSATVTQDAQGIKSSGGATPRPSSHPSVSPVPASPASARADMASPQSRSHTPRSVSRSSTPQAPVSGSSGMSHTPDHIALPTATAASPHPSAATLSAIPTTCPVEQSSFPSSGCQAADHLGTSSSETSRPAVGELASASVSGSPAAELGTNQPSLVVVSGAQVDNPAVPLSAAQLAAFSHVPADNMVYMHRPPHGMPMSPEVRRMIPPAGGRYIGPPSQGMYVPGHAGPGTSGMAFYRMPSSAASTSSAIGALLNQQRAPVGMSVHYPSMTQAPGAPVVESRYQLIPTQDVYLPHLQRHIYSSAVTSASGTGSFVLQHQQRGPAPPVPAESAGRQDVPNQTVLPNSMQAPPTLRGPFPMPQQLGPGSVPVGMRVAGSAPPMVYGPQRPVPPSQLRMIATGEMRPQMIHIPRSSVTEFTGPAYRPRPSGEQPLLLEDLLEQEKLEQRRHAEQHQQAVTAATLPTHVEVSTSATVQSMSVSSVTTVASNSADTSAILTDADVDKLNLDVMSPEFRQHLPMGPTALPDDSQIHPSQQTAYDQLARRMPAPGQHWMPSNSAAVAGYTARQAGPQQIGTYMAGPPVAPGVGKFGIIPAPRPPMMDPSGIMFPQPPPAKPPDPPGEPQTEEEQQAVSKYEEWLRQNDVWLSSNIQSLEQQVAKYRRLKKSLNARQRVARKNGNELPEADAQSLAVTSQEQSCLQKQLDQLRKQHRTHRSLMQEYQGKQPMAWQPSSEMTVPQFGPVVGQQISLPVSAVPPVMSPAKPMPSAVSGPRAAGSVAPVRLPPAARLEYEAYIQSRMRAMTPQGVPPAGVPMSAVGVPAQGTLHTTIAPGDENNPFSESFQQRERMEKLRQQEEQRIQMQRHLEQQHSADQSEHEMTIVPRPMYPGDGQMHGGVPRPASETAAAAAGVSHSPGAVYSSPSTHASTPTQQHPTTVSSGSVLSPDQSTSQISSAVPLMTAAQELQQVSLSGKSGIAPRSIQPEPAGRFPVMPPGDCLPVGYRRPPGPFMMTRGPGMPIPRHGAYVLPPDGRGTSDLQTFVNRVQPPSHPFPHDGSGPAVLSEMHGQRFPASQKRSPYGPVEQFSAAPYTMPHEPPVNIKVEHQTSGVTQSGGFTNGSPADQDEAVQDDADTSKLTSQNMLLKRLLNTTKTSDQPALATSTPTSASRLSEDEESVSHLTPEQQRQLAMIENMPYTIEKEQEDLELKSAEEKEQILEQRRLEFERRKKEIADQQPKVSKSRPRRPTKDGTAAGCADGSDRVPKKRPKKPGLGSGGAVGGIPGTAAGLNAKTAERSAADYSLMAEQVLQQLQQLPLVNLQEPEVRINYAVWPVLGSSVFSDGNTNSATALRGSYGCAVIHEVTDYYDSAPFVSRLMADQSSRPLTDVTSRTNNAPSCDAAAARKELDAKVQSTQQSSSSSSGISLVTSILNDQQSRLSGMSAHSIRLPSPPLIEPRCSALSRASDQSPLTIVSSSSPEPTLEPQGHDDITSFKTWVKFLPGSEVKERLSPEIPVICPTPVKATKPMDFEAKPVISDAMKNSNIGIDMDGEGFKSHKLGPLGKENSQVSVVLTLSASAADNIGGVIAAIADLLHIAIPPTYEISRSPSPPPFSTASAADLYRLGFSSSAKHKEEAINIQFLMQSRAKFCQNCNAVIERCMKMKPELLPSNQEQAPSDDDADDTLFCSASCHKQFNDARQQNTAADLDGSNVSSKLADNAVNGAVSSPQLSQTSVSSSPPHPIKLSICLDPQQGAVAILPGSQTGKSSAEKSLKHKVESDLDKVSAKRLKESRYKRWHLSMMKTEKLIKAATEKELLEMMDRMTSTIRPKARIEDMRKCVLCHVAGDAPTEGPGRLLNFDADKWVHLNCALWSNEVYETMNGALMYVDSACKRGASIECVICHKSGATAGCFRPRCPNVYHIACAQQDHVTFFEDKSLLCADHCQSEPENALSSIAVSRRVYVNRDENQQVARVLRSEERKCVVRFGGLMIHNIGQLLPVQIHSGCFNTNEYVYPVGYKSTRYYWSFRQINKRCRYVCKIEDSGGRPLFVVTVIERGAEQMVFREYSCRDIAHHILQPLEKMRRENDLVKIFPQYLTGEDLFGLSDPTVLKIIESLPGVELLSNYHFRYGRSSLYKLPLAVNPTGSARSEPRLKTHFKKPHTLHGGGNSRSLPSTVTVMPGDVNSPYHKQFVHSKSQQYRRLKTEWRNNVYLRRSNVQGLGLFAARDLEKHTMVIEYIGQLIRNEVAEMREKIYEKQNHGVYMFRLSDNLVVDATMAGGPARYINHSCHPNCVAEVVPLEKDSKIIIITKRKITQGEELAYDYKFDFEDDQHKIPCLCGAPNCRKWMN